MDPIRITGFGGIMPRTSERLIPGNAAQIAVNCKVSSGELVPFKAPDMVYSSTKTGPLLSIGRIVEGGSDYWLAWASDVDVVKSPLLGTAKWCFTGDAEPRITTMAMAISGGGNTYPNTYYTLGVPAPITAPTVGASGGSGAAVTRYYCYTFYSAWDEEGGVSPVSAMTTGKVDDTWAISAMDAAPPNTGTVTGAYTTSTEFTDTVNHWLRVGEEVVIASTTMVVTAITSTKKFKVAGDYHTETAWARKAPWNTMTKRLYRTSGTLATFEMVAEGITTTTYNDTLTDIQIPGDELISADWSMPPVDLKGLIMLPSGASAGFAGNKMYVSEPDQLHAYPEKYTIKTNFPIVGIGCFASGLVIATESKPYVVQGVEPGQMTSTAWDEVLPCVSKRSLVSLGSSVLYASPSGLISVGPGGVDVFSLPYFTEAEWANYAPSTMVSALAGRRLYLRYTHESVSRVLIFNLLGDQNYLTEAHVDADEIYGDDTNGRLYLAFGTDIYEFDPSDGYTLSQDWQSKELVLAKPANLGAAKVTFEQAIDPAVEAAILAEIAAVVAANGVILATGNAHGSFNGYAYNGTRINGSDMAVPPETPPANQVTFQFYAGGSLRSSRTVSDNRTFKLPSGYKADTASVRVQSQCKINSIELAETAKSLAGA